MPDIFAHRPSLPLSIQTQTPHTSRRPSNLNPSSGSFSPPVSEPATPSSQFEFARNLANTKSMSQNSSRFRRHASLDLGAAFRCRQGGTFGTPATGTGYEQVDSPITPYYETDEKGRLLSVSFPQSPMYSPFIFHKKEAWYKDKRNVALATAAAFSLFVFGGIVGFSFLNGPGARDWWGVKSTLERYGVPIQHASCENPFAEFGRMHVDLSRPGQNRWMPYDPTCVPPPLMAQLRSTVDRNASESPLTLPLPPVNPTPPSELPLPWLHGKTVLLFGDHVERNHNKDFCRFAGGKFASIGKDHPLSPPRFVNGIDEKLPGANQETSDLTRPAVCYIEEYDFMIVSVFHFGLANRVEFEHESLLYDPHFYPPVAVDDRLTHIVLPLLDSLKRPHPDIIEFSSGFWDLRHFAALDELAGQDPYGELSTERLAWYSGRLTHAIADVSAVFPNTPLLWRTLHHTPKFAQTSPARVAALDQLSRKVVAAMNDARDRAEARQRIELLVQQPGGSRDRYLVEREKREAAVSTGSRRVRKPFKDRHSSKVPFLNRVKQRIGSSERVKDIVLSNDQTSLRGLVRIDEWGALMRGQEHTMDGIFTPPLPGGFLWGDILLFELRRVVLSSHHRY
ncbi:hypothetical protein JCM8547_001853 [Rhodosporidiobolus lusitaniae]